MKFVVTEVDARPDVYQGRQVRKTIIYPMIMKTLVGYGADLRAEDENGNYTYTEELGRAWSKKRNKAMKDAIMANPEVQAEVAGHKVASYVKTCRCGCSGGFKVEGLFWRVIYVNLEQTE